MVVSVSMNTYILCVTPFFFNFTMFFFWVQESNCYVCVDQRIVAVAVDVGVCNCFCFVDKLLQTTLSV